MSSEILILLFSVALIAGFIDAIAGGGGLLTLPVLLSVGIPPANALATNKLQSCGGSFSASLYFIRAKQIDLNKQKGPIVCAFIGSGIGSLVIMYISPDFLQYLLPILTISISLFFILMPKLGDQDKFARLSVLQFALLPALFIGFYDGFFGPGTGSLYLMAFLFLAGFNIVKATAHTKVLNFSSNLASLLFFIYGGKVMWLTGLVMLLGQFVGASFGAKIVVRKGLKLIKPLLITVSILMSIKLIYQNFL